MPHYKQHDLGSSDHSDTNAGHPNANDVLAWTPDTLFLLGIDPDLTNIDLPLRGDTNDLRKNNGTTTVYTAIDQSPPTISQGWWLSAPQSGTGGGAGTTGATGPAGLDGLDGRGVTGVTGATGPAGLDGVDGSTGPAGGAQGVTGATGPGGLDGLDGAAGGPGATGATGPSAAVHAVSVYNSGLQSVSSGVNTAITFDSEVFDTDAIHSTGVGTSKLTIPTGLAGKWLVRANMYFPANATGQRYLYIDKNASGNQYGRSQAGAASSGTLDWYITTTAILDLSVGDYVEVYAFQDSGSPRNSGSNSEVLTFDAVFLSGGAAGAPGLDGLDGRTGTTGATGPAGLDGVDGLPGATGASGGSSAPFTVHPVLLQLSADDLALAPHSTADAASVGNNWWGQTEGGLVVPRAIVGAGAPTYKTNIINGHNVVRFSGSAQSMKLPDDPLWSPFTTQGQVVFLIFKPHTISGNQTILGKGDGTYEFEYRSCLTGGAPFIVWYTSPGATYASITYGSSLVVDTWYCMTSMFHYGTKMWMWINGGTSVTTTSVSGSMSDTGSLVYIGERGDGTHNYFNGDVAKIVVIPRMATFAEIDSIHTALAAEFGLTIGAVS